ncbi:hypothetical protein RhiirC2_796944 [Rhizophagus irregularis]|uniref:DUF8211 domain-containing protein n=1 Tax=Rhizophagus irregularis TaxID=588596 RepID=A0A2N1M8T9_9GLOM|nr:hypothetical protein RhiirC2_796944 [Rhizophagus irregularis]
MYERWETHQKKRIYSRRLGISYQTQYYANGGNSFFKRQTKPIYQKKYWNLEFHPSKHLRTPNETISDPTHYNFLVPFFNFKPKTILTLNKILNDSADKKAPGVELSPDTLTRPTNGNLSYKEQRFRQEIKWREEAIKNYNPLPDDDTYIHPFLIPYIPKSPLFYKKNHYIRNADPTGYATMVKEEKERLQREKDQPELDRRQKLASELGLCKKCKIHMAPTSAKNDPLREKILKFSLNFEDTVKKYYNNPDNPDEIIYSDTSEDTKAIEHRPRKRSTLINANLNIHKQALPSKHIRYSTDDVEKIYP